MVFRINGIRLAIDMEQIFEMIDPAKGEFMGYEMRSFHEILPFGPFGGREVSYASPKLVTVRGDVGEDDGEAAAGRFGVIIDEPEETLTVGIGSIRALPPLLEASLGVDAPIWGVVVDDPPILLVDMRRLIAYGC